MLLRALKNNELNSFPGLTYELIAKHLPVSFPATDKSHMVRKHQGTQSMRSQRQDIFGARKKVDDMHPPQEACAGIEDKILCFAMLADQNEGMVYSNLTQPFLGAGVLFS